MKKISFGLKILENKYDFYFIIRSDCILNNIHFLENIVNENVLYFYFDNKNSYTKNIDDKIKEHIIITKNFYLLKKLCYIYDFSCDNPNFCDITLFKFIEKNCIPYQLIDVDYKLILSKCNIIGISGDSGSGKSSLMEYLLNLYNKNNVLKLETDRYHKWERGNQNYKTITHLNPNANYLEMMTDDVYNLKIGNEIYQVDYDHSTGKFTDKELIHSKNNIILCGLHTLYVDKLNEIIDIKIYMDTDRELIKKWKIKRDSIERNHSIEKIIEQIEFRSKDYYAFIHNQRDNSDIVINFYENSENILKCNFKIKNKNIFHRLSSYFIKYNYSTSVNNNDIIVKLKNEYNEIYMNEKIYEKYEKSVFENNHENKYYSEILVFLILYTQK